MIVGEEEAPLDLKVRPWEDSSPARDAGSPYIRVCDSPGRSTTPGSLCSSPPSSPPTFAFRPSPFSSILFPSKTARSHGHDGLVEDRLTPPLTRPVLPFSIDNILKPSFGSKSPAKVVKREAGVKEEPRREAKKPEDCPPGMVRAANGQLVPAWVFCTRYSDRPSSGESHNKFFLANWRLGYNGDAKELVLRFSKTITNRSGDFNPIYFAKCLIFL